MASRVITRLAGTGIKLMGSVLKGAGSLVQKAGKTAPKGARDGDAGPDARRDQAGDERATG